MSAHASHNAPFEYEEYIEHIVPRNVYLTIFGLLMLLTGATVAVAFVDLGNLNVFVALAVAVAKASLVVLFFMHVKYSPTITKLVVIAALVWLGLLFGITMSDYLTRGWLVAPPIVR
jgi:cytochrome c oxidase subunit 4